MGTKTTLSHHARYLLGIAIVFFTTQTNASQSTELCETAETNSLSTPLFKSKIKGETQISADQTQILSDGLSRFTGNVVIEQHQIRLRADSADFNKQTESISLTGNIHVDTKAISLDANDGLLSLENSDRQFKVVKFKIPESNLRGEAEILDLDDENTSRLSNTLVTSCPINQTDWKLKAENLTINHEDSYGSAENAILDFKGVPFFYMPYLEFPIGDKRRSGILAPNLSSSNSRGVEFSVPWYWNIAPNHDATFTPRLMSKRGAGIETKYRYITQLSSGELNVDYLGHDSRANDARHYIRYKHNTDINNKTNLSIDFSDVSDFDYNNDFSNKFNSINQTYLDREIALGYDTDTWKTSILANTTETINASLALADRPYRRLPQIQAEAEIPLNISDLRSTISAEAISFDHEDKAVATGSRFTVIPGIHYSLEGDYWHLRPSFEIHHSLYDTTEDANNNPDFTASRTLPITSVDGGLYFERKTDNGMRQTLEPRIFYLNVPFKDQSNIPIFDTDLNDFNIGQLFRNNRFNGNDLVGDANQVSLALTSRLFNAETGNELLTASIGQIHYLADRKVTLPGNTINTKKTSDIIAEITSSTANWKLEAGTQWNTTKKITEKDNFSIQYKSDQNNIFNLSYRKKLNSNTGLSDVKHINTSFISQIDKNISLFGQWDYSLIDNRDISVLGGITYDSCCWQLSLAAQRFLLNDKQQQFDNTIMIQLSLKGFGGASGNSVKNTLRQSIPGYIEDY